MEASWYRLYDTEGNLVTEQRGRDVEAEITSAHLWSAENPYLYECYVSLIENQTICDEERISFGIRELKWSTDLFCQWREYTVGEEAVFTMITEL